MPRRNYRDDDRSWQGPGAPPHGREEYDVEELNYTGTRDAYRYDEHGERIEGDDEEDEEEESASRRSFLDREADEVRSWFDRARPRASHPARARRDLLPDEERRYRTTDRVMAVDVMNDMIATVRPSAPLVEAARIMRTLDCGALPVVDEGRHPIGIITDRDIACRAVAEGEDPRRMRVEDCMTDEVYACYADSTLDECLETMSAYQVRRLAVVDRRDRLIGVISQADLARHATRHRNTNEREAVADALRAISEPGRE